MRVHNKSGIRYRAKLTPTAHLNCHRNVHNYKTTTEVETSIMSNGFRIVPNTTPLELCWCEKRLLLHSSLVTALRARADFEKLVEPAADAWDRMLDFFAASGA